MPLPRLQLSSTSLLTKNVFITLCSNKTFTPPFGAALLGKPTNSR